MCLMNMGRLNDRIAIRRTGINMTHSTRDIERRKCIRLFAIDTTTAVVVVGGEQCLENNFFPYL